MSNPEFCTIHSQPMSWHESKTKFNTDGSPKTYLSHKTLDGKLCFGNPPKASDQPSQPVSEYNGNQSHSFPVPPPARDYEAENRGKVRNNLIEAHIQHSGVVPLTEQEYSVLEGFVDWVMNG